MNLTKNHVRRTQLIFGISGGSLMVLSSLLLGFKVNPPWLVRTIETEAGYVDVTFTFVLWLIFFIVGTGLVRRSITPKSATHSENLLSFRRQPPLSEPDHPLHLHGFPLLHLVAGALLLVLSVVQYLEWGADFSFDNGDGNWVFLGGPSLWYATGFFSLVFALILFGYVVGASKRIVLRKAGKTYEISENRLLFINQCTEIPEDRIRAIFISNNKTSVRFLWLLPLGLHLYYLGVDAFAYLCNPMAFSRGYITGGYYLLQAVADLVALGLILLSPLTTLEIHTSDKRYVLKGTFFVKKKSGDPKKRNDIMNLGHFFSIPWERLEMKKKRSFPWRNRQLPTGAFFIIIALFSRIMEIFAGELLRLALIFTGIVWIIRGLKSDAVTSSYGTLGGSGDAPSTGAIAFGQWGRYCNLRYFPQNSANTSHVAVKPRTRGLLDYVILGILPALIIWELVSVIIFVPPSFSGYWSMIVTHLLLSGLILGLLGQMYLKKHRKRVISLGYADFEIRLH